MQIKLKSASGSVIALLLYLTLLVAFVSGWIMNIMAVAGSSFDTITGMLVLRVVGIFIAPLGAVLGWV